MSSDHKSKDRLNDLVAAILRSYKTEKRISHLDSTFLPNRDKTIQIIELLRRIIFPGLFEDKKLTSVTVRYHLGDLLDRASTLLYEQVRESLRYVENIDGNGGGDKCDHCDNDADRITGAFLDRIPELRRLLALDVQAGFDGDPAAAGTDEIIFCYPGLDAIFIHRVAHELFNLKVPLLPRIMSEYAHNETGIDIHPGATIDESFFIDHGTGVVIGETTTIGKRVKIYQGVTLGALSTKQVDALRGRKRHPTLEDDVTIYAGATILGGQTVIGAGSTINGSVFLTRSVPPGHTVSTEPPVLRVKPPRGKGEAADSGLDYQV